MEAIKNYKIYVTVEATFTSDGRLLPRSIIWADGRRFDIDRVLDIQRAASLKAGGAGIRYTCYLYGASHYLYYEENNKWFVEARDDQ